MGSPLSWRVLVYDTQNILIAERLLPPCPVDEVVATIRQLDIRRMHYCDVLKIDRDHEWGQWQGTVDGVGWVDRHQLRRIRRK